MKAKGLAKKQRFTLIQKQCGWKYIYNEIFAKYGKDSADKVISSASGLYKIPVKRTMKERLGNSK